MKINYYKIIKHGIMETRKVTNIIFPMFILLFILQFMNKNNNLPLLFRILIMIVCLFKLLQIFGLDYLIEDTLELINDKKAKVKK